MYTISVEGNIGSGKTTFLNYFKTNSSIKNVEYFPEPVYKWINLNKTGINLLEDFYKSNRSFNLQIYIAITLDKIQKKKVNGIKITERTLESGRRVFAKNSLNEGKLSILEYNIIKSLYDHFMWEKPNEIIYLRSDPKICFENMKNRNRDEETTVKLDYLINLHNLYESWITYVKENTGIKVTILNSMNMIEYSDFVHSIKL